VKQSSAILTVYAHSCRSSASIWPLSHGPGTDRTSADGIPAHASFNLIELPDDALLTDVEVAAAGRWSTNTVAAWRHKPDHATRS
jgi:hypothetical protein